MNKIIITADFHIGNLNDSYIDTNGLESKVNETFKQIDYIINYAIKNKIKNIFILGDIFNGKRPFPLYYQMFIERLNVLEKNKITTTLVYGNHESSNSSEGALSPIGEIGYRYIKVIDKVCRVELGDFSNDCRIVFVPHITKKMINVKSNVEYDEAIGFYIKKEVDKLINESKRNIIMGHLLYQGAISGSEDILLEGGINLFPEISKKNISKIFLGHIHKSQLLKYGNVDVVYCGSIIRCDFGERVEDKHFVVYDVDEDEYEFEKLDTVEYKQININLVDKDYVDLDEEKIKKSVSNKIVKLIINVSEENRKKININEIESVFSKYCFISKKEINIEKKERVDREQISLNPRVVFKKFVEDNIKENKTKVLSTGLEIINELMKDYED